MRERQVVHRGWAAFPVANSTVADPPPSLHSNFRATFFRSRRLTAWRGRTGEAGMRCPAIGDGDGDGLRS